MGKSTTSMTIFNSYAMLVYQGVYIFFDMEISWDGHRGKNNDILEG